MSVLNSIERWLTETNIQIEQYASNITAIGTEIDGFDAAEIARQRKKFFDLFNDFLTRHQGTLKRIDSFNERITHNIKLINEKKKLLQRIPKVTQRLLLKPNSKADHQIRMILLVTLCVFGILIVLYLLYILLRLRRTQRKKVFD